MTAKAYNRVLDESVIEHNGKKYAWTIPLSLPVTADVAAQLKAGQKVALTNSTGEIVGTLDISDVFAWDKPRYLKSVYGTERTDHPGGDMVLKGDADKTHLLGGTVRVLPQPKHPKFGKYVLSPREVRTLLREKGWKRVVAFQTRNPLHRAHEYALVYGLEQLLATGPQRRRVPEPADRRDQGRRRQRRHPHADLRGADRPARPGRGRQRRRRCGASAKRVVPDRVILLGLDIKMFYGGPKEAVMHGIYRQNFGFTDIVIGRKHADAPYDDGTAIWGDFDAQEIFDKLKGDLKIQAAQGRLRRVLRVGRPRRPDGEPQGREAGVHLRQGRPQDAAATANRSTRGSCGRHTSKILADAMVTKA